MFGSDSRFYRLVPWMSAFSLVSVTVLYALKTEWENETTKDDHDSNISIVTAGVYLSPAACPEWGNLCAALHCTTQENRSAHSTSCSPLQTHRDTDCPQLCLPAAHTHTHRKKIKTASDEIALVTWDCRWFDEAHSGVISMTVYYRFIHHINSLRNTWVKRTPSPLSPASWKQMNGWTHLPSCFFSPVSPWQRWIGGGERRGGQSAKVHWNKDRQRESEITWCSSRWGIPVVTSLKAETSSTASGLCVRYTCTNQICTNTSLQKYVGTLLCLSLSWQSELLLYWTEQCFRFFPY